MTAKKELPQEVVPVIAHQYRVNRLEDLERLAGQIVFYKSTLDICGSALYEVNPNGEHVFITSMGDIREINLVITPSVEIVDGYVSARTAIAKGLAKMKSYSLKGDDPFDLFMFKSLSERLERAGFRNPDQP